MITHTMPRSLTTGRGARFSVTICDARHIDCMLRIEGDRWRWSQITPTNSGGLGPTWQFVLAAQDTSVFLQPGQAVARVTAIDEDDEPYDVGSHRLTVLSGPDRDPVDPRSHAEQMVAHLKAVIAQGDQHLNIAVAGQSYSYHSPTEIHDALRYWLGVVDAERRQRDLAAGKGDRHTIRVRM